MKFQKFFFPVLALVAAFFLAGCQTEQQTTVSPAETPTARTQQVPQQFSAADTAAYRGALELNDASFCDKIEDKNYQQQCKTEVADSAAYAEAQSKLDVSLCQRMSTEDLEKACATGIEVQLKQQQTSQEEVDKMNVMYEQLNKIIAEDDYTKCETLKNQSSIDSCESTILTTKALQTGDASYCAKITNKESQSTCQNLVVSSKK